MLYQPDRGPVNQLAFGLNAGGTLFKECENEVFDIESKSGL